MSDFLIIGAGVIGMSTALELNRRGASVTIYDKGLAGMESSWAAGGILSSMRPWAEHAFSACLSNQGKQHYASFTESLFNETGIDPEYVQCGLLMLGQQDVDNTKHWAQESGINWTEANDHIPASLDLEGDAILLPDIAQVRPSRLIKALKAALLKRNISLHENCQVDEIHIKDNTFDSIRVDGNTINADSLVICAGAWSSELLQRLDINLAVKPISGQMICLKSDTQPFNEIVLDGGHYLIPRRDGCVLVGSSMSDIGFNKELTRQVKDELLEWASSVWKGAREAELIAHWAGLRPANETGYPFIGPLANLNGISINTGHFRKGILQTQASAILLADHLSGESSFTQIENYSLTA